VRASVHWLDLELDLKLDLALDLQLVKVLGLM
jgi:hypothetical protein